MKKNKNKECRMNVRMSEELYDAVSYWSEKKGINISDYIRDAIFIQIKRDNKDYDLPSLEAQRLNQIIDALDLLTLNVSCMQEMFQSNFSNLLNVVNGTNYLLDIPDERK